MATTVQEIVLWVHLVTAAFFVGGSLFVWLVLIPASHKITTDEAERTRLVATVARRFGKLVSWDFLLLVATGVYNATWYLARFGDLLTTAKGKLLLVKLVLVALLLASMLVHDLFYAKRIARIAREGDLAQLRAIRRTSRLVSAASVIFMVGVLVVVILMQSAD